MLKFLKRVGSAIGVVSAAVLTTVGLFTIVLGLGGVLSVKSPESYRFSLSNPNTYVVTVDGGGSIMEFYQKYTNMRIKGGNLRVEGLCASACTFFLGLMPSERVCASENAYFGFHDIYTMFGPDYETYKWFMPKVYPEWVLKKLRDEYGFDGRVADVDRTKYPGGLVWMDREDLNIKPCPAE